MNDRLEHALTWVRPQPVKQQYVYLIRCGCYVKVGISSNPRARFTLMKVNSPHEMKLLKFWPSLDARAEEKQIHLLWEQYWVRGEWFKVPRDILKQLL